MEKGTLHFKDFPSFDSLQGGGRLGGEGGGGDVFKQQLKWRVSTLNFPIIETRHATNSFARQLLLLFFCTSSPQVLCGSQRR